MKEIKDTDFQPLRLVLLGASGSIGRQTIDLIRQHADKIELVAIAVHRSYEYAFELAREFQLKHVVIGDKNLASSISLDKLACPNCELSFGSTQLSRLASAEFCQEHQIDCVLNALVGAAGLEASYEALRGGEVRLALANKESLVVGGELLMPLSSPKRLLPVDSEHSAIYQCFLGEDPQELHRILLTASGGPFFGKTLAELEQVRREDALAHPNWSMGAKISVDSATLMNKGLEAIEALHLFSVPIDRIEIVVQRQSVIHSMVEFADGSIKAHLGTTDMRIPIQFALSYPQRWESPCKRMDFSQPISLSFAQPDYDNFPCLSLALEAARQGGTLACVMNAANEVAVAAFLAETIGFTQISRIIETTMGAHQTERVDSIEQLKELDGWARSYAQALCDRC